MASKIIVLAGPDEGRVFTLGAEPLLLGRSRATEGHLTDPHVSPVHSQIMLEGDRYILIDFESGSGTFLNGKEIQRHALQAGDLIRIGGTHLQFASDGQAAPAPAAAKAASSPAAWAAALVGQSFGHYRITAPLARGKTGYIFHGQDTRNETAITLKILNPEFSQDDKKVQRFIEAMKTVMPLSHPHLLKILGAGKAAAHCWLATEYIPGESLAAVIGRIERAGKIEWKSVLRVGIYLARALEFAHAKNLIHQNVTPQNIIVGKKPQNTKLTDLMLALATEEDPTHPISAAGLPSESLAYMSPERTDGPVGGVDVRTDIYSLAAVLYAMMTGKPPFQGTTVEELVDMIRYDAAPRLHAYRIQVPDSIELLLRRCLAKRPQDRIPTAADLRKEFEKIAGTYNVPM
ncbi:MAG: protein kinase [Planctomycetes bacterium]|nr:protein kinase [Planctomycetota bacterium]